MKHLLSLLTLGWMASLVWAQTDTYLSLEISAEGASDEDIVFVILETQPGMLDGLATLTLMGDDEQYALFPLPMGTMQGTVTAFFLDCQGDSLMAETFMIYAGADSSGMTLLEAELELPYCDEDEDEDEDEEEIESDCNAAFTVMQAFDNDSLSISNLLWVYVYDYDDDNDYLWSFGDEGTSTDPFPTWTYETDGPYELCLTVSNEEDSCSSTFCQTLSVDSLGWWTGLVDGFTINVFDAGTGGSVSEVTLAPENSVSLSLYPNPVHDSSLNVEWTTNTSSSTTIDVLGLDGRVLTTRSWNVAPGAQRTSLDVSSLASGIYLVRISDGNTQRTQRVVIR